MGKRRGAYRVLVGKPEGRRPRRRWEDNIKIICDRLDGGSMDWIDLAQGQVASCCEYGDEPSGSIK
jgi:hypothetical protein